MAGKTSKGGKKKKAKAKIDPAILAKADDIVKEIIDSMKAVLDGLSPKKQFTGNAFSEWKGLLKDSVAKNLDAGQVWEIDKDKVLAVAGDMAMISAIISADDTSVGKARVHASFRAAKAHKKCPGTGGGAWCDFDI